MASGLYLIQFKERFDSRWTSELTARNIELIRSVPEDAFLVRLENAPLKEIRKLPYVRWVGEYRPDHKLHPRLKDRGKVKNAGEALPVSLLLSPKSKAGEILGTRRLLRSVQGEVNLRFGRVLRGFVTPGQLEALAKSPAVLWIEPAPSMKLFDEVATKIVAGDDGVPGRPGLVHQAGYDGRGVTVAVADSGLHNGDAETMHPDLAGRVMAFFHYGALEDAADEHSHGTHVAGIVAGNGAVGQTDETGALYGVGVAPRANIVAQRLFDGEGGYEPPPSFESMTRDAVRAGADIGSNSWGDDTQGRYDISAMEFDALVRDADALLPGDQQYILEFSAGNAGPAPQSIGSPAVAKNVIATGAAQNNRFDFFIYAEGQETMADFSSRGPCEDGRIKPDLVAPGTWIASLQSASATDEYAWLGISGYYYQYQGGTSQSGPHVSGGAAVFVQYYRENYGGLTPSPALVKAALINSAVNMDDSVETDPAPNMDEGWGRMDLTELLLSVRGYEFLDQTELLATGQTYERRLLVNGDAEPFKITLVYTDVPGFPGAIPALVNDLDLEVIGPDGAVYRGNQFDDGESVADAAATDNINNVEGVHLFSPLPGEYIVRVHGRNVMEDARVDTGAVDQDFALVISADIPFPGVGVVLFDRRAYTVPSEIGLKLIDLDLAGQPSVNIHLRSDAELAGEAISLFASGSTGSFTGRVSTALGPAVADGRLQIAHDGLIEAIYQDASAGTRTATARGDLLAPVLSNVSTESAFGKTFVQWQSDEPANSIVRFGTNANLINAVTNRAFEESHEVVLEELIPGRTYFFEVISSDYAGNTGTNDNGGALFSFVAEGAPTVLLVDAYVPDDTSPFIPLSTYTDALDETGVSYDVWEVSSFGSPTLNVMDPYRVVMWRLSDSIFSADTFSSGEMTAIRQYVGGGGSFFFASMEQLTRLATSAPGLDFMRNVLQVQEFAEDVGVPEIVGLPGNNITEGVNMVLDYEHYYTEFHDLFGIPPDLGDTLTVSTNATPILLETAFFEIAGLSYPRVGQNIPGRVVFLPFPLDAAPTSGSAPSTRAGLLRTILQFLAPGEGGVGDIALNSPAYTVPSLVTVEVADSDLISAGETTATFFSSTDPTGRMVTLKETARAGLFRGTITLVPAYSGAEAQLRVQNGDTIRAEYFDASSGSVVSVEAIVETVPPVISNVEAVPDYTEAYLFWETSEPSDALVQFGESILLGRTAYRGSLAEQHELTLIGLQPDKTYFYQVVSRDQAGNTTVDDNGGQFYTFRTLRPLLPPWYDDLEHSGTNWVVYDSDETEVSWELGVPQNGVPARSPVQVWSSNLRGNPIGFVESFLISPPIELTGGNQARLRFWQNYDFFEREGDIFEFGQVLLVTNTATAPISLGSAEFFSFDWEEAEFDLTPHLGKVVYVVWYYVLFSFENHARPGWSIDDVSVTVTNIVPGTVVVTNNLSQAVYVLTGPSSQSGEGFGVTIGNAAPGEYRVQWGNVPYYQTPPTETQLLQSQMTVVFQGNYTFTDANGNGMSDAWEQVYFGEVSPARSRTTDTDGDGYPDYAEFMAGTNPTEADSILMILMFSPAPNGPLRFEWASVPGRSYQVQGGSSAVSWTDVSGWIRARTATTSFTLPAATPGAPYLFRLQVRP